jgi:hypothetical protein
MTMRSTVAGNKAKGAKGFPAEAAGFFDELTAKEIELAKAKTKLLMEDNEFEVVDGIDYPYHAHA